MRNRVRNSDGGKQDLVYVRESWDTWDRILPPPAFPKWNSLYYFLKIKEQEEQGGNVIFFSSLSHNKSQSICYQDLQNRTGTELTPDDIS
jgi:hypothetical protein